MLETGCYCKDCLHWDKHSGIDPNGEHHCQKMGFYSFPMFGCVAGVYRNPPPPNYTTQIEIPEPTNDGHCNPSCWLIHTFRGCYGGERCVAKLEAPINWQDSSADKAARPGPKCPRHKKG